MKVLIIVAHGSKVQSSNDEIKNISDNISLMINSTDYDEVKYAFLELAEPTFEQVLNSTAKNKEIKEITVFPYFLAAGKHVKSDIPEIIEHCKVANENVQFKLLPHFGKCNGIESLILANS